MLRREPRAVSQVNALARKFASISRRSSKIRPILPRRQAAREWLAGIGPKDLPVVEAFLKQPTKATSGGRLSRRAAAHQSDLCGAHRSGEFRSGRTPPRRSNAGRPGAGRLAQPAGPLATAGAALPRNGRFSLAVGPDRDRFRLHRRMLRRLPIWPCIINRPRCGCWAANTWPGTDSPRTRSGCSNLLDDRDRSVKLAAIRALGNCGNQVAVRGLKPDRSPQCVSPICVHCSPAPTPDVRFAAAVSLCRLGTPEGMQELVRLSYHANPDTREQAVKEMGLSGQTRFVSHLVGAGMDGAKQPGSPGHPRQPRSTGARGESTAGTWRDTLSGC